jgi:hypothetical protein
MVELDFHEIYSIDLAEPGLLAARSWRWLFIRLVGLISTESRIQRALNPTPEQKKAASKRVDQER